MRRTQLYADNRARLDARARIVRAANGKLYYTYAANPFTMKHLQRAVFRCRQLGLVTDDTLVTAGFRPRRRPNR